MFSKDQGKEGHGRMPPKLSLPPKREPFFLFQNYPRSEGNCETAERQKLSRGNFCPATSIRADFSGGG